MMLIEFVSRNDVKVTMSRQQLIDINAILTVAGAGYSPAAIDQKRAAELSKAIRESLGR